MKNWIYITIFSEKFPNQYKKQTNSKVPSNILPLYKASSLLWWLSVKNKECSQTYLVYKFNICFIRLENVVSQKNPFIIHTTGQLSIQCTTLNQLNVTKQIFLNIYHFPSTLALLKYQDPFIEYAIFESCLLQPSCLSSEFQYYLIDCEFQYHSLFKQGLS